MTRGEQYKDSNMYAPPKVSGGSHVLSIMNAVGFGLHGEPLSNQEVLAWSQLTGINLDCWTASIVTTLSGDYMNQWAKSTDPACPPPFVTSEEPSAEQRAMVANKFKSMVKRS